MLLGDRIFSKLSFNNHVSKLCQKAFIKLSALAPISPFMDESKEPSCGIYYQPISILSINMDFSSRQLNQKISKIQDRALRITYLRKRNL